MMRRTREALQESIAAGLQLGGQVYVSRNGRTDLDEAFGEVRPAEALSTDHLLLWMSSSKPVAAVAIAQLWERGLLRLDDRVAQHIPEFGVRGKEIITIRHLLTHTGGIRMLDVGWPRASWEEIIAKISRGRLEPRWVPGKTAGYHLTASWFILGELVRRADGRPFELYVREEIFEPLGMLDSWIGMPVDTFHQYAERLAPVFDTQTEVPTRLDWSSERRVTRCSPGGNGWGPARELGRFYEMLLGSGSWEGVRVLLPQTVEALTARHRTGLFDKTFRQHIDWGLGFVVNGSDEGGKSGYGHWPSASSRAYGHSGYRSSTAFADPEHRLAVVILLNGTPDETSHLRRMRAITTAIYKDLGLV
jgi:CubicO group peptidase (beta-lactamase class C family)